MKRNKLTAFCTALTLLAGSLTALPVSAENTVMRGDVDVSGEVNVADAVKLARYNAEDKEVRVTEQGLLNADMNLDGKANADDSAILLEVLAGLASVPESFSSQNLMSGITVNPAKGTVTDEAFRQSQLALALNLLRTNCTEEQNAGKNVMVSPLSVAIALAMTANGAKGTALSEMEQVIGGGISIAQLNDYYAYWLSRINAEKGDEKKLYAADAIWFRDNDDLIQVPEEFLQTCADYYGADVYKAPFDKSTLNDINNWCKTNTHDMIEKVIDELSPDCTMVLANALAFEAEWSIHYDDYQVHDHDFTLEDGTKKTVQMMSSGEYTYLEDAGAIGFEKYYKGGNYSFAAILPPEGKTVDEYIASLDAKGLQALLDSRTTEYDVYAALPKFKFDFGNSLKKSLKQLGMPTSFNDGEEPADFTGLNNAPGMDTWIGDVIHKTFIDLSETGTKAAAVTVVTMETGCAMEEPPVIKYVTLDRPFVFMILDKSVDLPVFIGAVKNIGENAPAADTADIH